MGTRAAMSEQAALALAGDLDSRLMDAIASKIGWGFTLEDLRDRMRCVTYANDPENIEYYVLDGEPIMKVWPPEIDTVPSEHGYKMQVTRKFESCSPLPVPPKD